MARLVPADRLLERNPTWKAEMEVIENPDDATTRGKSVFVTSYIYPVMQVANILLSRAHLGFCCDSGAEAKRVARSAC